MSQKLKYVVNCDAPTCQKYVNKVFKHDSNLPPGRNPPLPKYLQTFQVPPPPKQQPNLTKPKPKPLVNQPSPPSKAASSPPLSQKTTKSTKDSSWGQLLKSNKSKDKVSSFGNFDPLRTLHFLTKELNTKLKHVAPDQDDLHQMVVDIQHALRRIPPEVSTLLHNPNAEYPQTDISGSLLKTTSSKTCQTPPTLYQEDTEKFQRIMEENTCKLEASCKQLEQVCTNLQREKEQTEKELEKERENVEILCRKVDELEEKLCLSTDHRLTQLQQDKRQLDEELARAKQELSNGPSITHLKKLIQELQAQKKLSDENCAQLEYDMTILRMEKEKFVTMLAIRDKEVKDIQEEMTKIQEQVNTELKKLNNEVVQHAGSLKQLDNDPLDMGDSTISSLTTNGSVKDSCGDTEESHDSLLQKLKATAVEIDLPCNGLGDFLNGLSPSLKALLTSSKEL